MKPLPKTHPTQRIRLSSDDEVLEATSEAGGDQFAREIIYLGNYVPEVGRILAMKSVQFGVVEDTDDQVAYRFSENGEEIEGIVSGAPHPLGDITSGKVWTGGETGS